jgi:hypothetical protein
MGTVVRFRRSVSWFCDDFEVQRRSSVAEKGVVLFSLEKHGHGSVPAKIRSEQHIANERPLLSHLGAVPDRPVLAESRQSRFQIARRKPVIQRSPPRKIWTAPPTAGHGREHPVSPALQTRAIVRLDAHAGVHRAPAVLPGGRRLFTSGPGAPTPAFVVQSPCAGQPWRPP